MKFLIVGTVRNVEKTVQKETIHLQKVFSKFGETHFYLVESDSEDSTLSVLQNLQHEIKNFKFHTLGKLDLKIPNRVNRIRFCRNAYVKFFRQSNINYDFVVVCDWDGINTAIRPIS